MLVHMQHHVFIIGSRGLPAKYGGFETFVENLVTRRQREDVVYHVACLDDGSYTQADEHGHFSFQGVDCFVVNPARWLGPARVIAYDMMALDHALAMVRRENILQPVFCILGNTIGPLVGGIAKRVHDVDGRLFVNPDGLEFKRSKWPKPVRSYLKYAEKCMAKHADVIVSDNEGIQEYMERTYPEVKASQKSVFIAYGTDTAASTCTAGDQKVRSWYAQHEVKEEEYYLIVGRFVPENNYEAMIREFMASKTKRDLVIITNYEGNAFFEQLRAATHFDEDPRVKFVGTVYDRDLLTYIRENAFAYLHGHSVGGTNPGLLEALSYTDLNLVLDVAFNHSVARDACVYWKIAHMDDASETAETSPALADAIAQADELTRVERQTYGAQAKYIIARDYTWEKIVGQYEELFTYER